jgi:hypothetical protein
VYKRQVLLLIIGVQFVSMGFLGELVVRTYHESQDKPIYAVRERLDQAPAPGGASRHLPDPGDGS